MSPKGKRRFQLKLKSASIGAEDPEINKVQKYLTRFGYMTNTISPGTLDESTSEAIAKFQQVMNLKVIDPVAFYRWLAERDQIKAEGAQQI